MSLKALTDNTYVKKIYIGYAFILLIQTILFLYTKSYITSHGQSIQSYDQVRSLNQTTVQLVKSLNKVLLSSHFKKSYFLKSAQIHLDNLSKIQRQINFIKPQQIQQLSQQLSKLSSKIKLKEKISKKDIALYVKSLEDLEFNVHKEEKKSWNSYLQNFNKSIKSYSELNQVFNFIMLLFGFGLLIILSLIRKLNNNNKQNEEQKSFNLHLLKSLDESVFVTNQKGELLSCNTSASLMIDQDARNMIGEPLDDLIADVSILTNKINLSSSRRPFVSILENTVTLNAIKVRFLRKSGIEKWYLMNAKPIFSGENDGSFTYLFSFTDITENILSQETIKDQYEKILSASQFETIGKMAGGIAHEINNPLFIIGSQIEMLDMKAKKQGQLNLEEINKRTSKISHTVQRLNSIVKGILALSHKEALEFEKQNLKELIATVADFSNILLKDYSVELQVKWESLNIDLECHPVQISQVVLNLIKNACQAITNDEQPWIEIKAKEENNQIKLFVTDSGTKLTDELKDKILMPYYTTKKVGEGTGLGLNISKSILDAHNGSITISRKSKTTQFIITLPKFQKIENLNDVA